MFTKRVSVNHFRGDTVFDDFSIELKASAHVTMTSDSYTTSIVLFHITTEDLRRIRAEADKGLREMNREAQDKVRAMRNDYPYRAAARNLRIAREQSGTPA